ncbi:hypothetical protein SAMN02927895_00078 [Belnapia rosea]|nr:hypothetical protein SAMN02927895_00078 [Belnapia rosea]
MSAELSIRGQRSPSRYSPAFGGSVERLPEGWVCGRHCDIGGDPGRPVRMDLVLMHPGLGIALLDIGEPSEGAEQVLRGRLEEARFGAIFGGYLPIIQGRIGADEVPVIAEIARAFDRQPPLSVSGGSAWMSTACRLITPIDRIWADNWEGAPNRLAGQRPSQAMPERRATVVPLRRMAAVPPPAAEPDDMTLPPIPPKRSWMRWGIAAGGGLTGLAALALLAWPVGRPAPEPARPVAAQAPVAPATPSPTLTATPVLAMPAVPPPILPAAQMQSGTPARAAVAPVVTPPPTQSAPAAKRPPSRQVRIVRPVRDRAATARKPARPAQPAATRTPGRT